jgi:hypothetical protein
VVAVVNAHFVNRHDVRVLKHRCGDGFALEPLGDLFAGKLARQNEFHRNQSAQALLSRLIDHSHPAARDLLQQFVITE